MVGKGPIARYSIEWLAWLVVAAALAVSFRFPRLSALCLVLLGAALGHLMPVVWHFGSHRREACPARTKAPAVCRGRVVPMSLEASSYV